MPHKTPITVPRWLTPARQRYMREYEKTPKRRAYKRRYQATPQWKEANRVRARVRYHREDVRARHQTPEAKIARAVTHSNRNAQRGHYKPVDPTTIRPIPQNGLCECCLANPGKETHYTRRTLSLDHDHKTGKFRGWICYRCNIGFGYLGDSLERLKLGVTYFSRT